MTERMAENRKGVEKWEVSSQNDKKKKRLEAYVRELTGKRISQHKKTEGMEE